MFGYSRLENKDRWLFAVKTWQRDKTGEVAADFQPVWNHKVFSTDVSHGESESKELGREKLQEDPSAFGTRHVAWYQVDRHQPSLSKQATKEKAN